jgi:UDPglucose 6-dehydrogenase
MKTKIAVYDPKVSRKKMLADLDYLESRTTEKNTNSMLSFKIMKLAKRHTP